MKDGITLKKDKKWKLRQGGGGRRIESGAGKREDPPMQDTFWKNGGY